jgi:hypothetical protein
MRKSRKWIKDYKKESTICMTINLLLQNDGATLKTQCSECWRSPIGWLLQELGWRFLVGDEVFDTQISLRPRNTRLSTGFPTNPGAISFDSFNVACSHSFFLRTSFRGRNCPREELPRTETISCDYGDYDYRHARRGCGGAAKQWGRSCMGAPSMRALGARSWYLRPWWNSQSSYVFSTLISSSL